jgi:predicted SprT family Zn-dependent metalloprotease
MKITNQTIQQVAQNLWEEYCEIFPKLVKFDCPKVTLNGRLSKCAGRNTCEENSIELGTKFFTKYATNMIAVILPHEIAHQIDWNLNGWYDRKPHHGKQWIEIMVKIGQNPNAFHEMVL